MLINRLSPISKLQSSDVIPVETSNGTKKTTVEQLFNSRASIMGSQEIIDEVNPAQIQDYWAGPYSNSYKIIVHGPNNSGGMTIAELLYSMVESAGAVIPLKRSIVRGSKLGESISEKQLAAIADGSFKGLYLGDYWVDPSNNVRYRIVDFDYWMGRMRTDNKPVVSEHHVVIMPDTVLNTFKVYGDGENQTTLGYGQSRYRKEIEANTRSIVENFFGSNILDYASYTTNAAPDTSVWIPMYVDLPTTRMILGNNPVTLSDSWYSDVTQLSLFRVLPERIKTSAKYLFRDIIVTPNSTAYRYAELGSQGNIQTAYETNTTSGARPVFAIKGA